MFTNIRTFSGGTKAWKASGYRLIQTDPVPDVAVATIDAETFKKNFDQYCVVDIRIRKHYAMGLYTKHLNAEMNALSTAHRKKYIHKIPLPYLTRMAKKVPLDRPIVVVDYKGKQAPLAVRYLQQIGHPKVCMLEGGLIRLDR